MGFLETIKLGKFQSHCVDDKGASLTWQSPTMSHAGGRLPRTSSYERQSQWYASRGGWDAWKSVISDKCSDMISFSSPKMVEGHRSFVVRHVVSSTWWMQMTNPSWRTHCRGLQLGLSAPRVLWLSLTANRGRLARMWQSTSTSSWPIGPGPLKWIWGMFCSQIVGSCYILSHLF